MSAYFETEKLAGFGTGGFSTESSTAFSPADFESPFRGLTSTLSEFVTVPSSVPDIEEVFTGSWIVRLTLSISFERDF